MLQVWHAKTLNFVIGAVDRNFTNRTPDSAPKYQRQTLT
jgi:hypothetical protein